MTHTDMSERIHRVLDGELDASALSERERRLLAQYTAVIREATSAMGRVHAPDLTARVEARLDEEEARRQTATGAEAGSSTSPADRLWRWLWRPRSITLRPAYALVAAAVAVLSLPLVDGRPPAPEPLPIAAEERAPQVYVHFRLDAPDASSVRLAGDFTDWEPAHELHQVAPGVWSTVVAIEAGVHDYAFIVDGGQWRPDPLAMQVADGFGGTNSRLSVLPPEPGQV